MARDPRRTNDELYLAELLIEAGHNTWRCVTKATGPYATYQVIAAHRKKRLLNPAYRAKLNLKQLAHTVEVWAEMDRVTNDRFYDRPVRDLSALRFFPHLARIELRTELVDLSGLNGLKVLRFLDLSDGRLEDLEPLARHTQLEELALRLDRPWPSLGCLRKLTRLEKFVYNGNLLALSDVVSFPAVQQAQMECVYMANTPLCDLQDHAPHMPTVRNLKIESVSPEAR